MYTCYDINFAIITNFKSAGFTFPGQLEIIVLFQLKPYHPHAETQG